MEFNKHANTLYWNNWTTTKTNGTVAVIEIDRYLNITDFESVKHDYWRKIIPMVRECTVCIKIIVYSFKERLGQILFPKFLNLHWRIKVLEQF